MSPGFGAAPRATEHHCAGLRGEAIASAGLGDLTAAETRRAGASEQLIGVAKQEASVDAELPGLQTRS